MVMQCHVKFSVSDAMQRKVMASLSTVMLSQASVL